MSFKPVVQVIGNGDAWCKNSMCFETKEEALRSGNELASRWIMVTAVDAHESTDEPNYRIVDDVMVPIEKPNEQHCARNTGPV